MIGIIVSQKSLSLSEINTSSFRGYKVKPRANSKWYLKENWKTFRNMGLHFIHLDINSLLSKIDELREIIKISNQTVIGITETKLDNSIIDSEISINR